MDGNNLSTFFVGTDILDYSQEAKRNPVSCLSHYKLIMFVLTTRNRVSAIGAEYKVRY